MTARTDTWFYGDPHRDRMTSMMVVPFSIFPLNLDADKSTCQGYSCYSEQFALEQALFYSQGDGVFRMVPLGSSLLVERLRRYPCSARQLFASNLFCHYSFVTLTGIDLAFLFLFAYCSFVLFFVFYC